MSSSALSLLRTHVQNPLDGSLSDFHVTPDIWSAAAARHPALAARLDVSIGRTRADFDTAIGEAEILVTWVGVAKETMHDIAHRAPRLKMVFCTSAGIERLMPLDWLPSRIALLNNSGTHSTKAGEWGIMAILMLANHMPVFATHQRERRYEKIFASSVAGRTLVAVGTGAMAVDTLRLAKSLGMRVIGVRNTALPHAGCDAVVTTADLDRVLPEADFLLLTCPLTPQTRNLIDRRRIGLLKPQAGIVNMARGAVIDQDALCDALDAGRIAGAILDVVTPEPLPADSRVWTTRNLSLVPHVSADDPLTYTPRSLDIFFANFARWIAGEPMPNQIDPTRGY
jgi:phosphoglycerate dehydrogenase-like enzyme